MKIQAFFLLLLSLSSCKTTSEKPVENQLPVPSVSKGSIERLENFKSGYVAARHVDVWLPPGYSSKKEYSVLYMHDGQMLFDSTTTWNAQEWGVDEKLSELIQQGAKETIVVGVWNSGNSRFLEYYPQKAFESLPLKLKDSLLQGNPEAVPFSDQYLKFLVLELKPHIDGKYSTKKGRENTFIAGSSMGGLISWYAVCEYPEVFGGAACLSTHWVGNLEGEDNPLAAEFISYLGQNLPSPGKHKFYFDYGTETLDAAYEPHQKKVDSLMIAKGYTSKNWMTKKFEGADHSENSWKERLGIPLNFLLTEE